jgi:desulfoferrodoxin (superoxide reductase-like protein)
MVIKTNQLMTFEAKIAVCSEIHIKHSMQSEHHVEFLNVKPGGT